MQNSTYTWQGITHLGVKKYGIIYAKSKNYAKQQLASTNIILHTIHKKTRPQFLSIPKKSWFCRQLATLINAHIPLYTALELLDLDNQDQKFLIATLLHDLDHGKTLVESLQQHPQIFDDFFCSIIAMGETSGTLYTALNLIAVYYENTTQLHKNIKKMLSYPLIVFCLGWLIIIGICIIIVPQFEDLFNNIILNNQTINLPFLTKIIILFSHIIRNYGMHIFFIISSADYLLYKNSKILYKIIKTTPIIKTIYQKTILTKFIHTLSMICTSGVSLNAALELISKNITTTHYYATIRQIINDMHNGQEIADAFANSTFFPKAITSMLKIGTESGRLHDILQHLAKYCHQDLEENIAFNLRLFEPLITISLGIFVGGIVAALYIPLLQLGNIISL